MTDTKTPANPQDDRSPAAQVLQSQMNEFNALHPSKKKIVLIILLVVFVVSLMVGINLQKKRQEAPALTESTQEAPTPQPTSTLTLSPATGTLAVGQSQEVSVVLADVPVSAVDIVLTFDPTLVSISAVANGDVFDRVIRNSIADGTVTFSASVSPEKKDQLQEGTIATFTVTGQAPGQAIVTFDTTETITALGGQNTLGTSTGATFTVASGE